MWKSREKSKPSVPAAPQPATQQERSTKAWIGQSVIIKGDVISAEDLTIDGQVEGKIEVGDHNVTVGAGASIVAELVARNITIGGAVKGNVTASDKIEIRETGSVDGDIRAQRIAVREGAVLRGRIDTRQPAQKDGRQRFPIAV